MQATARHTGRASSGHSGHSVLVGGRARAHAHKESSLKSVSAVQQLPSLLALLLSPGRCQVFPRKLIPPVVLSTAINTSLLLTMQCPDVTPGARCVSLVSAGLSLATGCWLRSRSRGRHWQPEPESAWCDTQPGLARPEQPGSTTVSVITLQSHLVIRKIHIVCLLLHSEKDMDLMNPSNFSIFEFLGTMVKIRTSACQTT